ncbi:hypothetical protein STCU_07483 [Strigomonas culicis]|uniref:Uncharacterized protein n=1 Tax=Strigomonas culicis TaxID=28005 RepID=S9TZ01_9TRYP|nr:hypothetical protein STCU_07483 [Strigomonas culicis]|eukprot:EPY23757.1 hypothetical protein STCU_07483 [Strigomonas culicis]
MAQKDVHAEVHIGADHLAAVVQIRVEDVLEVPRIRDAADAHGSQLAPLRGQRLRVDVAGALLQRRVDRHALPRDREPRAGADECRLHRAPQVAHDDDGRGGVEGDLPLRAAEEVRELVGFLHALAAQRRVDHDGVERVREEVYSLAHHRLHHAGRPSTVDGIENGVPDGLAVSDKNNANCAAAIGIGARRLHPEIVASLKACGEILGPNKKFCSFRIESDLQCRNLAKLSAENGNRKDNRKKPLKKTCTLLFLLICRESKP